MLTTIFKKKKSPDAFANQSYQALIKRKFKRNTLAYISFWFLCIMGIMICFSYFFSPNDPNVGDSVHQFSSPQGIHFVDHSGKFHLRPVIYGEIQGYDNTTLQPITKVDYEHPHPLGLFVKGFKYSYFGMTFETHLFGTLDQTRFFLVGADGMGHGLWERSLKGGQITLLLALLVVTFVSTIGVFIGSTSAYIGGTTDTIIQRITEFVMIFPALPFFLTLVSIVPKEATDVQMFIALVFIMSSLGWAQLSRQIRGVVLSLRRQEYIKAAFAIGASDSRVITRHIFPNIASHITVLVSLRIPMIVLTESFFSFLGLGIQAPMTSWGTLLYEANNINTLGAHPWLLFPVVFIVLIVIAFNLLGDGLRDAIDPYAK